MRRVTGSGGRILAIILMEVEWRADELDHRELLELDPDGGVIRFAGQRALLLDAVAMELLRKYLVENFGITAARTVLIQFGFAHGLRLLRPAGLRAEALRRARRIRANSGSRFAAPTAMTTSTTKNDPPASDAKPGAAAIEPPTTRETQPGLAVRPAASGTDLESRIQQRRGELIATLGQIRADPHLATTEVRDRLKARLSELAHIIKVGVVDGWTNLGDTVKHKLEHWLAESERSMKAPSTKNK